MSAQKRIAALEETRQNLLRQLAEAVTLTEQESIKRRLEIVEAQLSAAEDDLGAAQQRVQLVPVSVTIDADRALAGGDDAGGWSLGDAVDDAGKVLSVTAGVLLVSAAVLGPLAILAALIWLAAPRAQRACGASERSTRRSALLLVGLEVRLAGAADGAEPVVGDLLEGGARRDAAVRIALLGVVDEAAGGADPELSGLGLGGHRAPAYPSLAGGMPTLARRLG